MNDSMMPEWWFYHLSRSPLETAIPPLLIKCLERGWRVLAISPSAARRGALDAALWVYDEASFVPHGQAEADGLDPARQPVLISPSADNLNGADIALLMDGAELAPNAAFTRCMVMFDGDDVAVRDKARQQYKAASDNGCVARYFQQAARGWQEAGAN